MYKVISSTQNQLIKDLFQLKEKSRVRKASKTFLIEGLREISLALKGNYSLIKVLVDFSILPQNKFNLLKPFLKNTTEIIEINSEIYKKLAHRDSTEGILALANAKSLNLNTLELPVENPLILIAEAVEKPGNLGALLRTADAAGAHAVILANPNTDLYNPNTIRSSVGSVFTNNIAMGSSKEIIEFLQSKNIKIYSASLTASVPYHSVNFKEASAIVVGTEATGLTPAWLDQATKNIIIPMFGEIDSMNVSVSASIILFEAVRQRTL
jgi:TrmH family RNA methyltransferase